MRNSFCQIKNLITFSPCIFLVFVLFSFTLIQERQKVLKGVWVYSDADDGIVNYVRSTIFDIDKAGIEFLENGKLYKRQNVSSCGTPPITYNNDRGTWELISDSTLTIKYNYWGGEAEEDWLIKELSSSSLKIKRINYRAKKKLRTESKH